MADIGVQVAIEEISVLKARYFRFMDTKQWDQWADLFTEDCEMWVEDQPEVTHHSRDEILAAVPAVLEGVVTVHHGHMPEISVEPTTPGSGQPSSATGIWAMADYLEMPAPDGTVTMHGYGHYHETYRRGDDGRWRIAKLHLHRLRVDWER